MLFWAVCGIVLLTFSQIEITANYLKASSLSKFDNFRVDNNILRQINESKTIILCGLWCLSEVGCQTLFYREYDGFCQLNIVTFFHHANWISDPGVKYFEIFTDNCPKDLGYIYHRSTSLCYKFSETVSGKWEDSRARCVQEGGDLVVLDTDAKYRHIVDTIKASSLLLGRSYHVGGTDLASGEWRWLNGEIIPMTAELWENAEQSFDNRHYAIIKETSQRLEGVKNLGEYYSVCQIQAL